jgi:hypothetical protein
LICNKYVYDLLYLLEILWSNAQINKSIHVLWLFMFFLGHSPICNFYARILSSATYE